MPINTITATRYITPLREGGSLPAVIEADDGELYVMKFVGAGQGARALVAEVIAGEIGRSLGLPVPELAFVVLDPGLSSSEPNDEISNLIKASSGLNLGMRYLRTSFAYSPLLQPPPGPELASGIVWFDAYITNVDRTIRNTNILVWRRQLWLIDHGASLYFHHDWRDYLARSRTPFPLIKDHVLLRFAAQLDAADAAARSRLNAGVIREIVAETPDAWLDGSPFPTVAEQREAYVAYLTARLEASEVFVDEAKRARAQLV